MILKTEAAEAGSRPASFHCFFVLEREPDSSTRAVVGKKPVFGFPLFDGSGISTTLFRPS
jgi:hypothetical protein